MPWTDVASRLATGRREGLLDDDGFTLVELMVAIAILFIAGTAFYQLLFSVAGGVRTTESVARVTDEARLGFNRMVRDTREGQEIDAVSIANPQSFNVLVDFNADGVITPAPNQNANGDYEDLTYSYDAGPEQVRLNGELLMSDVECVLLSGVCRPVFDYASERLEYDWNGDGLTTWQEIDEASSPTHGVIGVGNNNGVLDAGELPFISSVVINLRVVKGDSSADFYARAQLRNNR
jgi:prepilin-type N-terminal cleavage/methylation domain-containing protein